MMQSHVTARIEVFPFLYVKPFSWPVGYVQLLLPSSFMNNCLPTVCASTRTLQCSCTVCVYTVYMPFHLATSLINLLHSYHHLPSATSLQTLLCCTVPPHPLLLNLFPLPSHSSSSSSLPLTFPLSPPPLTHLPPLPSHSPSPSPLPLTSPLSPPPLTHLPPLPSHSPSPSPLPLTSPLPPTHLPPLPSHSPSPSPLPLTIPLSPPTHLPPLPSHSPLLLTSPSPLPLTFPSSCTPQSC